MAGIESLDVRTQFRNPRVSEIPRIPRDHACHGETSECYLSVFHPDKEWMSLPAVSRPCMFIIHHRILGMATS